MRNNRRLDLCRYAVVAAILAATPALADGISNNITSAQDGIKTPPGAVVSPGLHGKVLLVNGIAFLLLNDGVNKVCLAGGCV